MAEVAAAQVQHGATTSQVGGDGGAGVSNDITPSSYIRRRRRWPRRWHRWSSGGTGGAMAETQLQSSSAGANTGSGGGGGGCSSPSGNWRFRHGCS